MKIKFFVFIMLLILAGCSGKDGGIGQQGPIGPQGGQGIPGDQGETGPVGNQGPNGQSGYIHLQFENFNITNGVIGEPMEDIFIVAKDNFENYVSLNGSILEVKFYEDIYCQSVNHAPNIITEIVDDKIKLSQVTPGNSYEAELYLGAMIKDNFGQILKICALNPIYTVPQGERPSFKILISNDFKSARFFINDVESQTRSFPNSKNTQEWINEFNQNFYENGWACCNQPEHYTVEYE